MKTPLTVETVLTTLDALAVQARQAADAHARRFPTSPVDAAEDAWQAETLGELARQIRRLVISADQQINP